MRQLSLAFVSALILLTAFVAPVGAAQHPVVTTVPRAGAGTMAVHSLDGVVLLLVAASALLLLVSIRQWRRA